MPDKTINDILKLLEAQGNSTIPFYKKIGFLITIIIFLFPTVIVMAITWGATEERMTNHESRISDIEITSKESAEQLILIRVAMSKQDAMLQSVSNSIEDLGRKITDRNIVQAYK